MLAHALTAGQGPNLVGAGEWFTVDLEPGAPDYFHVWHTDGGVPNLEYIANCIWPANTWNNIELIRFGDTLLLFLNGLVQTWTAIPTPMPPGFDINMPVGCDTFIGGTTFLGTNAQGRYDECRLSIGHAAHLESFIPFDRPYTLFDL